MPISKTFRKKLIEDKENCLSLKIQKRSSFRDYSRSPKNFCFSNDIPYFCYMEEMITISCREYEDLKRQIVELQILVRQLEATIAFLIDYENNNLAIYDSSWKYSIIFGVA